MFYGDGPPLLHLEADGLFANGLGRDLCSRGAAQPTSNTLNRSPMCRQTQVVAMFDDNDLMVVVTLLNIGIMLSVVGYHYVAK